MADNGSPFVEDPGPGFDSEQAAAGAEQVRADHDAAQRAEDTAGGAWTFAPVAEEQVRAFLFSAGDGVHAIAGVGEWDWRMTRVDLDRIAPPLTRIVNRYDAARALAQYSDEGALVMGAGLYAWRSLLERSAVLREAESGAGAPPRPAAGPAAPEPPAPPPPPPPPPPSPAPPPPPAPAGAGDHFPGAGTPRDAAAAAWEVAPGYTTHAQRIREARERSPVAVPLQTPGPS